MTLAPVFGWTLFSRDSLRGAESQLKQDSQGVRDEIGFLAIHQAYSDRFFPGTSVLHTRLRYVLFVPWLYERVSEKLMREGGRPERILQAEELTLAGRLKQNRERGVIGGDIFPKPTAQPPSMVYWSALAAWGILKPNADGSAPSRADLNRVLQSAHRRQRLLDDDKIPIDEVTHFFVRVPDPPTALGSANRPIDFVLTQQERSFLRQKLIGVRRPGDPTSPSLLSRLAGVGLAYGSMEDCWHREVIALADDSDKGALKRARYASALAAIGRGVYAALLESTCERMDGLESGDSHRLHLKYVTERYGDDAMRLKFDELASDSPRLANDPIKQVLGGLQDWLKSGANDFETLRLTFEQAECRRKGQRARLVGTMMGRQRREEWSPDDHMPAAPLHFRWPNVRRLLSDLHEQQ
jgi:hypothetical protein